MFFCHSADCATSQLAQAVMELLLDSHESDGISLVLSVAEPDAVWGFGAEENQPC